MQCLMHLARGTTGSARRILSGWRGTAGARETLAHDGAFPRTNRGCAVWLSHVDDGSGD
jgi:hypothetical protein